LEPEPESIRPAADAAPWPEFPRQLSIVLLLVGGLALVAFLSFAGQTLALGLLFALLLYRPIRWAGGRIRYRLAVAVSHLLVLAGLVWVAVRGIQWVAAAVNELQTELGQLPATGELAALIGPLGASALPLLIQTVARLLQSAAGLAGVAFIAIILSFWLLNDLWRARGALRPWFSRAQGHQVAQMLQRLDQIWLGYLTAQVIFGLVMTVASIVEYVVLGVPYPLLMAVLTGVLTLIPSIGGIIASLIVAVPCLLLGSTRLAMDPVPFTVLVTVINIVITQVSYNLIAVPIVGRYVRLPAALVLLAVLVGVITGSFIFAFLVVPLLSSLRIVASFLLNKAAGREPFPDEVLSPESRVGLFGQLMLGAETPPSEKQAPEAQAV
jgi:predicted PurR-regulated permease PerM